MPFTSHVLFEKLIQIFEIIFGFQIDSFPDHFAAHLSTIVPFFSETVYHILHVHVAIDIDIMIFLVIDTRNIKTSMHSIRLTSCAIIIVVVVRISHYIFSMINRFEILSSNFFDLFLLECLVSPEYFVKFVAV